MIFHIQLSEIIYQWKTGTGEPVDVFITTLYIHTRRTLQLWNAAWRDSSRQNAVGIGDSSLSEKVQVIGELTVLQQ